MSQDENEVGDRMGGREMHGDEIGEGKTLTEYRGNNEAGQFQPAEEKFEACLAEFRSYQVLRRLVLAVLSELPAAITDDFLRDPKFHISVEELHPGGGTTVWMACPGTSGDASRSIILRRKLENRSVAFAKYVIAHEFAHAHLHNGGWGDITDPEEAADALAASWGFRQPDRG